MRLIYLFILMISIQNINGQVKGFTFTKRTALSLLSEPSVDSARIIGYYLSLHVNTGFSPRDTSYSLIVERLLSINTSSIETKDSFYIDNRKEIFDNMTISRRSLNDELQLIRNYTPDAILEIIKYNPPWDIYWPYFPIPPNPGIENYRRYQRGIKSTNLDQGTLWHGPRSFAFIAYDAMKLMVDNHDFLLISPAVIETGITLRSILRRDDSARYFTLKIEGFSLDEPLLSNLLDTTQGNGSDTITVTMSNFQQREQESPNIYFGTPCPPYWRPTSGNE